MQADPNLEGLFEHVPSAKVETMQVLLTGRYCLDFGRWQMFKKTF